jgi:hypothetical protein
MASVAAMHGVPRKALRDNSLLEVCHGSAKVIGDQLSDRAFLAAAHPL